MMVLRQRLANEDKESVAVDVLGQISTLAEQIRRSQEAMENDAEARDILIYRLSIIDVPNKRIAEASGLTHGRISQIVKRIGDMVRAQEAAEALEELKEGRSAAPARDSR